MFHWPPFVVRANAWGRAVDSVGSGSPFTRVLYDVEEQDRIVTARYRLSLWSPPSWLQGRTVLVGGGGVHTQSAVHFCGYIRPHASG